jgi:hypothetical protein
MSNNRRMKKSSMCFGAILLIAATAGIGLARVSRPSVLREKTAKHHAVKKPDNSMRRVDFRNYNYYLSKSAQKYFKARPLRVRNGEYKEGGSGPLGYSYFSVGDVSYGVTNDGLPEAAVLGAYGQSGTNFFTSEFIIFRKLNGRVTQMEILSEDDLE